MIKFFRVDWGTRQLFYYHTAYGFAQIAGKQVNGNGAEMRLTHMMIEKKENNKGIVKFTLIHGR